MMADTLRVVLVDDEDLVRSGLRLLLSNAPDIEVVAEASNGRDAVATVLDTQPDVVLMDIRMPVMDGIAAVEKILSVHTVPIIMLTAFDTDSFILRALRAGAAGFLLKSTPPESLMAAVRAGVGRETAHEVIKENAVAVALNMRENGGEQDLVQRLAADDRLPMDESDLEAALADKHAFIGAAESQVNQVLNRINALVGEHPKAAAYTPGEIL